MFGREVVQPPDLHTDPPEYKEQDYVEDLRNIMDATYSKVMEQSEKNLRRQKRNYDKQVTGISYEIGSFVSLKNDLRRKGVSPKLSYRWDGPLTESWPSYQMWHTAFNEAHGLSHRSSTSIEWNLSREIHQMSGSHHDITMNLAH